MPDPTKEKNRKLTREMKDRVISLAAQGIDNRTICSEVGIQNINQVLGIVNSAKNRGLVPRPDRPASKEQPAMTTPAPVQPRPMVQSLPSAPAAPSQDFDFKAVASPGGYNYNGQSVKYLVERIAPQDGLLGTHTGTFEKDDLGRLYGEGTYRITKQEPGRLPMVAEVQIGGAYGRSRWPRQMSDRAAYGRDRHDREREDEETQGTRQQSRPFFGPYEQHARPSGADSAVAAEAVKALGNLNERALEQVEKAQSKGPDTYMTKFFAEQQQQQQRQRDEERERWERERKEREERDEKRRRDDNEKWQRQQVEDEKRHDREIERIKTDSAAKAALEREQRQTILEIEQKKIDLIREDSKRREEMLNRELERTREEFKAARDAMRADVESAKAKMEEQTRLVQESVEEEIERGQKALEKEHGIRMEAMAQERKLHGDMFKLREEMLSQAKGDEFSKIIGKIAEEFGKAAKEVIELKKIEAVSPEAHAASIARGSTDGNVVAPPQPKAAPKAEALQGEPPAVPTRIAAAGNGNGGHAAGLDGVDGSVGEFMGRPEVRPIIREWVRQVQTGSTPVMFGHMFMEFLRDPEDHKLRKASHIFASFMNSRSWEHMLPVLKPSLSSEEVAVFETPEAEEFYNAFRTFVIESVKSYSENFIEERDRIQKAGAAAPDGGKAPEPQEAAAQ